MKKTLILVLFVALVVPQITFASWWNPLSWFNHWSFFRPKADTSALEVRIQELEKQLQENEAEPATSVATSTATSSQEKKSVVLPKATQTLAQPVLSPVTLQPIVSPVTIPPPTDFRADCMVSSDIIKAGMGVTATIKIYFDNSSNYEIAWDANSLVRKIKDTEALYTFYGSGNKTISVNVKRRSDGYSKVVTCPLEVIEEESEAEAKQPYVDFTRPAEAPSSTQLRRLMAMCNLSDELATTCSNQTFISSYFTNITFRTVIDKLLITAEQKLADQKVQNELAQQRYLLYVQTINQPAIPPTTRYETYSLPLYSGGLKLESPQISAPIRWEIQWTGDGGGSITNTSGNITQFQCITGKCFSI